jgi:hypothetical protein
MRSQVFPQMSSDTRVMPVPGGKLNQYGRESFYGPYGYARQDVGKPYQTRPATTRPLQPQERRERVLADRNEAFDKANQFHQDRINAAQNLPTPTRSFSQGGPEFNPFQPVGIRNFSLDDPRVRADMRGNSQENEEPLFPQVPEEEQQARLERMAREAVLRDGTFSWDKDPEDMHPQTRSIYEAMVRDMMQRHIDANNLPMRT